MININLIDETGTLTNSEVEELKSFIIDDCLCTSDEIAKLKAVKVRDDGPAGYSGYWTAKYIRDEADIRDLEAVIVLNAYYLKTMAQLKRTLAHEFGHHWTLGYFMDRHEMIGWFNEHAPWLYYRIRGMSPSKFAKDYSKGWSNCDKEVLAEDYKYQFTPFSGGHRMQHMIGNPTSEVRDYVRSLGRPYWL